MLPGTSVGKDGVVRSSVFFRVQCKVAGAGDKGPLVCDMGAGLFRRSSRNAVSVHSILEALVAKRILILMAA